MPEGALRAFVRQVRSAARDPNGGRPDLDLVTRFVAARDEAAFAALVQRHGRMVRTVCRNVLGNEADAEEAVQATFLLLARRAPSLSRPEALPAWLHGVAYRTALRARRDAARRRAREAGARPAPPAPGPVGEASWRELQAILDEELQRLPDKLRTPFVLCCLERHSKSEAARLLGWKPGTVSGRLDEARKFLRRRLARRGVSLSAVLCGLAMAGDSARAGLPAAAAAETARAALRFAGGGAAAAGPAGWLAEAALRAALAARVRTAALVVLALGAISAGAGLSLRPPAGQAAGSEPAAARDQRPPAAAEKTPPRADRFGDALPDGAVARFGTKRFGHSFYTDSVLWSPDGKVLACLGGFSTARGACLLDSATGKELYELPVSGSVVSAAFSPDSKTLATAEDVTGLVLWDVATGKQLASFTETPNAVRVAFAPDGRAVAAASRDGFIRVRDLATGRVALRIDAKDKLPRNLAYSPDGKFLVSVGSGGEIVLWDVTTGAECWRAKPHGAWAWGLAFTPDGKTLATTGADGQIRLRDLATGKELAAFGDGDKEGRQVVAYSPDGRTIATSGPRGSVALWDPATGKEVRHWDAGVARLLGASYSPDGRALATGGVWGSRVRIWDPATGRELHPASGHSTCLEAVGFADDGKTLWSLGRDKVLIRWDVGTGDGRPSPRSRREVAWQPTSFTPDGHSLATGRRADGDLCLWYDDGREPVTVGRHAGGVAGVALSADAKLLASSGSDGAVRLWDVAARKELRQAELPKDMWGCLAFSPDGRKLATAAGEQWPATGGSVRLVDVATGKELLNLECPRPTQSLAFSPDGRLLAAAGDHRDKGVRVWDVRTGKPVGRCVGHSHSAWATAFSPDGRLLATGGDEFENTVRLWEVASCDEVACFRGHHSGLSGLAFSPDGRTLASGAGDATVLLWDLARPRRSGLLTPLRLEACWKELGGGDAGAAYRAVRELAADPDRSVPFLRSHLRPAASADAARVAKLFADLDADAFEVRTRAQDVLEELGDAAEPALRKLRDGSPSAEARKRAERLLEKIADSPEWPRTRRAIAALEYAATPEARRTLEALAGGTPGMRTTDEARAALGHLTKSAEPGR